MQDINPSYPRCRYCKQPIKDKLSPRERWLKNQLNCYEPSLFLYENGRLKQEDFNQILVDRLEVIEETFNSTRSKYEKFSQSIKPFRSQSDEVNRIRQILSFNPSQYEEIYPHLRDYLTNLIEGNFYKKDDFKLIAKD